MATDESCNTWRRQQDMMKNRIKSKNEVEDEEPDEEDKRDQMVGFEGND